MSDSPFVSRYKFSWSHNLCRPTSISRPWCFQGDVLWHPNSFVSGSSCTNTNLKGTHRIGWVLCPRIYHSPFTAIGNLLVVRGSWQQIHNSWILLTAMRYVSLEFWTIALFGGLGSHHVPDHFLLCPCPPQSPTRRLNVAILLEVIHCNNCLQMRTTEMRKSREKIPGMNFNRLERVNHWSAWFCYPKIH